MTKQYKIKPKENLRKQSVQESFTAPAPPSKGKIYAIDQHPDTNTVAVIIGQTPHDMLVKETKGDMNLNALVNWLSEEATAEDQILVEAGNGCFELVARLAEKNLLCCVLESTWIGGQASKYVDSDKLAAVRIARVYLQGNAKAVWTPDQKSQERRELLHSYSTAVKRRTQAINGLKSYLTKHGVRLGRITMTLQTNQEKIIHQYDWSSFEKRRLADYFAVLNESHTRVRSLEKEMILDLQANPEMLKLMGIMGIGKINAFALIAVIGNITRFSNPKKLASYLGLNPSQKTSGKGKMIKVGTGKRGRRDMRSLLIQAAQAVLRKTDTPLGKWGIKLLMRKGHRNIAVAAVARKLSAQVWHLLMGNKPDLLESSKHRQLKFKQMLGVLGKQTRAEIGLPKTLDLCVTHLEQIIKSHIPNLSEKQLA